MQEDPRSEHDQQSDQNDSFFPGEAKAEEDEDKKSDEPGAAKHKLLKQKKKHINKKKEKTSKQPKKQHTNKEKERENRLYIMADKQADQIIDRMRVCYQRDLELYEQKKLACQKLNYLEQLSNQLKNLYICDKFVEKDGLSLFQKWLDKITVNEESFEPSVSLRKGVMEILLHLNINTETVSKTNEVQRLVARQKRSQVKELRDLGEKIILKWNKIAYEAE